MFIKITNGQIDQYPYTLQMLRAENPNTSFPKSPSDETLASFNVFRVTYTQDPDFNYLTEKLEQQSPALIDGVWTVSKSVVSKTNEEIEADKLLKSNEIRNDRDQRLAQTDWMALSDNTLTQDWAAYRQALRDLPSQEGFPYNVAWPDKPE